MISLRRFPIATVLLIAANIVAAFAILWQDELVERFGFVASRPGFDTAVTSLFLHTNVLHLLGNMLFLAAVGASVELATGSSRFLAVYFLSGLAGVAVHWWLAPRGDAPQPLVGASGSVAGCAAYYTARYTWLKVPLSPKFNVSVMAVTVLWLALQFAGAMIRLGDAGPAPVSFWAHLGGFAMGLILCVVFRAPDAGHRRISHAQIDLMAGRSPAATMVAAEKHLRDHPNDVKALTELAWAAETLDDAKLERETLTKLLDLLPEMQQAETVARLAECDGIGSLPPIRRVLLAEKLLTENPDLAKRLLQSVVDDRESEPQRPEAMLALAGIERNGDRDKSQTILRQLEAAYPLHPAVGLARARGWLV